MFEFSEKHTAAVLWVNRYHEGRKAEGKYISAARHKAEIPSMKEGVALRENGMIEQVYDPRPGWVSMKKVPPAPPAPPLTTATCYIL